MQALLVRIISAILLFSGLGLYIMQPALAASPTDTASPTDQQSTCDAATQTCQTDIGAVPTDTFGFVSVILNFAVGIGGLLALILIIWGGFRISTSNGNIEEVAKGREIITYSIVGLILILFAVIIVRVVGPGGILGVPDFGG